MVPVFGVRVELGNAAMSTAADVATELRTVAARLECGDLSGRVSDGNGTGVGSWMLALPTSPGVCDDCGTGGLDPELQRDGEDFLLCDECRDDREER